MRVSTKFYAAAMMLLVCLSPTLAQNNTENFKIHNNWYISFGAGSSILRQLPSDIYFAGSSNLQLGLMYERALHKKFSVVSGIEFEQATYSFDGDFEKNTDEGFTLIPAGNEKKYTGLRQRNLAIPLQFRYYFLNNYAAGTRNMFIQSGLRLTQSLDFTEVEGLETTYFFRSLGEDESVSLSEYANQTSLQLELMIGFKGQFFKNFDLLNASTLGFMYQLNPVLGDNSTEIYPLHFTWRFLF
jgi:hypothetical protein